MSVTVRPASPADAAHLAEVAAVTFPLACPPHSTAEAQAAFIAEVLSEARFVEYIADANRAILIAEADGTRDDNTKPGSTASDVAEADNTMIGYTMLVFGEPHDPDVVAALRIRPTVELSKCYVLPGHHGAGIAGELMTASLDVARERGATGIWLGVNEENTRAHRFYGKHGFERVGTKHFRVGDAVEDDFVLERAL
ncbi:MAG: GNAT family N-acetyltransferase [Microbacteriaceae bacterium]